LTINDILRSVARFRRLALLVAIVTLAVGTFAALSPPDRYRATSTVLVQPKLANGQAVSVQVVDFLVPSFIKTIGTRSFRADAAERVEAAARGADVHISSTATTGTGILTVQVTSTTASAVAPWADALAEQLVRTTDSDFVDLTVIDDAIEPSSPYAPSREAILGASVLVAALLALLSAVAASAIRGRGDRASELRERFGAAVLGEIPRLRGSLATLSPAELITTDAASRVVEALQTMRANVTIALAEQEHPWFVVTSADPSEGKSFISTSLAWLLASVNRSTILVDGDSRRPTAHRRVGAAIGVGLESVGPDDLSERLQPTENPRLRFLGAGSPDRHPAEIASTHLPHLLRQATAASDVVIIDSPPLPSAAETIVYASGVGAVLLVIDARRRDLTNVERVISALHDRDVKILGVVINRSRRKVRAGGYYAQAGARRAVTAAPVASAPPPPPPPPVVESEPAPTAPPSDDAWSPPSSTPQPRWEWPRPDPATPSD
jgi:capsular exopolysaccharide synthesis family protein